MDNTRREGPVNAAKYVGISATGLNVNWMDEEKLQGAKKLLEGNQEPQKKNDPLFSMFIRVTCGCKERNSFLLQA